MRTTTTALPRCRAALLEGAAAPDVRRAALAAVHFPEQRTLAADEPSPADELPASCDAGDVPVAVGVRLEYSEAGYDPAFMLPFSVQARCLRVSGFSVWACVFD